MGPTTGGCHQGGVKQGSAVTASASRDEIHSMHSYPCVARKSTDLWRLLAADCVGSIHKALRAHDFVGRAQVAQSQRLLESKRPAHRIEEHRAKEILEALNPARRTLQGLETTQSIG